ncbi:immunity 74 family protein [Burkholderia cenocepacia]|uniref:Imm74 family immunity protein n=1 Tax=Burkholderia cenocepacia TaxID=95486 RepID=UPI002237DB51|nr:Imm74 family immunity protein [Burkholderia cenocepacia]MCW5120076.1 immunity 74 family protein [Burkholderia cenocepacia]MCW5133457.1 immunity 74 family protein [Burkholderia cenocepacia]MCW5175094.1 immunity 74 family protein [Burkholderia cenocepacia]
MTYTVPMVSRGEIVLSDGNRTVRVPGEALSSGVDNGPAFVVYVDSMKYVEPQGDGETIDNATREAVISAITAYFFCLDVQRLISNPEPVTKPRKEQGDASGACKGSR